MLICFYTIAKNNETQEEACANIDDDRYDMVECVGAGQPDWISKINYEAEAWLLATHAIRLGSANVIPPTSIMSI